MAKTPQTDPTDQPSKEKVSSNDELLAIANEIRAIARQIPTPGVLDSQLHGQQLQDLADRLQKFAASA